MTCEKCKNRIPIPGNCHIGCKNTQANVKVRRWPGCGIWPFSFDENIVIECDGRDREVIETEKNSMLELARLMS